VQLAPKITGKMRNNNTKMEKNYSLKYISHEEEQVRNWRRSWHQLIQNEK
jgi:hypothetical protein